MCFMALWPFNGDKFTAYDLLFQLHIAIAPITRHPLLVAFCIGFRDIWAMNAKYSGEFFLPKRYDYTIFWKWD